MTLSGCCTAVCRRNSRLDSFLKRNTDPGVYERIRVYEPCVVVSNTVVNKAYMHVVLSDERVYLTEYTPRTLTVAVSFRRVRDIELVSDLPDFLSRKDQERCQHIRIIYTETKPAGKRDGCLRRFKREKLPSSSSPSKNSYHINVSQDLADRQRTSPELTHSGTASTSHTETRGLVRLPQPPSLCFSPNSPPSTSGQRSKSLRPGQVSKRIGLFGRDGVMSRESGEEKGEAEREAELHLYTVSQTSTLYRHLQSAWNTFIIRSTLMLDPTYRRNCGASQSVCPPVLSLEQTAASFALLRAELLQEDIGLERLYLLLQELRAAARCSVVLRKLFWRSSEMCAFLVRTLEESLRGCQRSSRIHTEDQLLLSSVIVQTLAEMFRDTEVEPARLTVLTAQKGALTSRMLLALICDPQLQTDTPELPVDPECRVLLREYLDAACSLMFELLRLGQEANPCPSRDNVLTVGWIITALNPHPHLLSFVGYQAQQVVLALSDTKRSYLSPVQSVLLFRRCRLLLACLQYSRQLRQHLRSSFREEFRFFVNLRRSEEKLPPLYPISRPALRLIVRLLTDVLHR